MEKALELLSSSLRGDQIEARLALDPEVPQISADPHQLQQVVMNLIQNARQAMKPQRGGRLTLRTRYRPDPPVVVGEVEDNGPGIPPDVLPRIFDPFVTTKAPGEGTGLGLSICYTIASAHGGTIRAENLPGGGARFTVEIPALPPPRVEAAPVRLPSIEGARILVVDDEAPVREVLRDFLSRLGTTVEEAASGAEALSRLREAPFDLVTLDFRMPGLSTPEVWELIRAEFPGLPVVMVTGDIMGQEVMEFIERARVPLIPKPFSLREIHRVIAAALRR
jgi:two-component system NtrC family sensor kinase